VGGKLAITAEDFIKNKKMDDHHVHWEIGG
jgi:hypothetical protein